MRDDPEAPRTAAPELMGHPAVDRARAAQHLVNTVGYRPERFVRIRNEAVAVALRDGVPVGRIADALEVLPAHVRRMSRDHAVRTASPAGDPETGEGTIRLWESSGQVGHRK